MNIENIKKKVDVFKHDWEISRQCCDVEDFSDEVLYLLSIIEQKDQLLKEWWVMFAELGQTTRESFRNDREFGEFVKLAMATKRALQAIRGSE